MAACDMTGWSISRNPKGMEVRAGPDGKAKILGRLAPAKRAQMPEDEEFPPFENLWRTQFQITGYKDGWFQIGNAAHPYEKTGSGYEHRRRLLGMKSYAGRGWVRAETVGGMLSNRARPEYGAIWQEPRAGAPKLPLKTDGRPWGEGSYAERVFACQGEWVEVQIAGVRGWWPGLCSAESG
ncbi:MAG: SH3 domain-containing protein, partial [Alphaproteobacteria bacterium]|nr:SH3 domain-containing protein [Alphaproteobacteria bacterium]